MKNERKTILQTISFEPKIYNFLHRLPSGKISEYVNQAIKEKTTRETTKEGKIRMLKTKRRELGKKINEVDEKLSFLEEGLNPDIK